MSASKHGTVRGIGQQTRFAVENDVEDLAKRVRPEDRDEVLDLLSQVHRIMCDASATDDQQEDEGEKKMYAARDAVMAIIHDAVDALDEAKAALQRHSAKVDKLEAATAAARRDEEEARIHMNAATAAAEAAIEHAMIGSRIGAATSSSSASAAASTAAAGEEEEEDDDAMLSGHGGWSMDEGDHMTNAGQVIGLLGGLAGSLPPGSPGCSEGFFR